MITITTFTGREINPLALKSEDICIEDIAHALAQVNRFAGHARWPLSVAQHSVLVSLLCDGNPGALEGLLHDASEAYLGDVTKWLKESDEMKAYRIAEQFAQDSVFIHFNVNPGSPSVKWADTLAVRYEFELAHGRGQRINGYGKLTQGEYRNICGVSSDWPHLWRPVMSWQEAEAAFLMRFTDLKR